MRLKNITIFSVIVILLLSCKKEVDLTVNQYTRRLSGEWNVVSYKVDKKNVLLSKNFFTTKYGFYVPKQSASLIFFVDCDDCPSNTMGLSFDYSDEFRVGILSPPEEINTERNPFSYKLISDTNYETYWRIRKLSKRILRIDNLDVTDRVNDVEMVLEK